MLGLVGLIGQPRTPYRQGVSPKHHSTHGRVAHLCRGFVDRAAFKFPVAVTSTKFPLLHVAKVSAPATDHAEEEDTPNASLESKGLPNLRTTRTMLCLSNGHGEDSIAASILTELLALANETGIQLKIKALPLVGEGHAFSRIGIPTIGPAKSMPSGGFIYMDILQLLGDLRAGLLSLTLDQISTRDLICEMKWAAVVHWVDANPDGVLLAVGDIFPLAMAWLASKRLRKNARKTDLAKCRGLYSFVGTAKSEFYVRRGNGSRLHLNWFGHVNATVFSGSVYYPWERALMADPLCRLVVPRDGLTAQYLQKTLPFSAQSKVQDLGNPMMDGLDPVGGLCFLDHFKPANFIALLPGSRPPEVYANWRLLINAAQQATASCHTQKLVFVVPIVPSLEPGPFMQALSQADWQPCALTLEAYNGGPISSWVYDVRSLRSQIGEATSSTWPANNGVATVAFEKLNTLIILIRGNFNDVAHWAQAGIAMAGTATEQLVGQGKPVFTLPGMGPQFTAAFAEAQSRLLDKSIILCSNGRELSHKMQTILSDKELLAEIADNGRERMGDSGAARRISAQLISLTLS